MYASAMGGFGMHDRWNDGGFHPWLGLVMMLAVALAIGLAVWLLLNRRTVPPAAAPMVSAPAPSPTAAAESILAERLARSEITPDDYRSMIAALREQPPVT
jgi:putative membrane protein